MNFTRLVIAKAMQTASGLHAATAIAAARWPGTHIAETLNKSAVPAGTTTDSTWAAPLVAYGTMADEFVEALRPATLLGRIQGLVPAPTMTRIPRVTSGSRGTWVGENSTIPVSRMSFDTLSLPETKIATIVALSNELMADSRPSAEGLIRRDLIGAVAAFSDAQFIDPSVTVTSANPASITNGATTIPSSGSSVAAITSDVLAMFAASLSVGHSFGQGVWIMNPRSALFLSAVLTTGGARMWPEVNVRGGSFFGLPVLTSASVPIDTGDDTYIVLLDASEILFADGTVRVDVSRHASLQLDSTPSDSAAQQISLWQKNLAAVKITRYINWQRRRDTACAVLSNCSF